MPKSRHWNGLQVSILIYNRNHFSGKRVSSSPVIDTFCISFARSRSRVFLVVLNQGNSAIPSGVILITGPSNEILFRPTRMSSLMMKRWLVPYSWPKETVTITAQLLINGYIQTTQQKVLLLIAKHQHQRVNLVFLGKGQ